MEQRLGFFPARNIFIFKPVKIIQFQTSLPLIELKYILYKQIEFRFKLASLII